MPTVKLTVPPNAWTKEEKAQLVARLTAAVADTAKDTGKGDITQFVGVQIEETAEGGYAIGGKVFG
ncbi:MAG: tautomerase family protein [Myxococcota bacterium]